MPATERLNADLVLCLGLLHHLILGEGRDLGKILEILSALSKKALILEYVDLSDRLIQNEPSFFNHLNNYTPNNYNISVIIETGRKYFKEVEILDSYPDTRKLLVFEK